MSNYNARLEFIQVMLAFLTIGSTILVKIKNLIIKPMRNCQYDSYDFNFVSHKTLFSYFSCAFVQLSSRSYVPSVT